MGAFAELPAGKVNEKAPSEAVVEDSVPKFTEAPGISDC
jgi:hypothetical protein